MQYQTDFGLQGPIGYPQLDGTSCRGVNKVSNQEALKWDSNTENSPELLGFVKAAFKNFHVDLDKLGYKLEDVRGSKPSLKADFRGKSKNLAGYISFLVIYKTKTKIIQKKIY